MQHRSAAGFTLMELLLVIGIIGVLAAMVIIAINPNKQLAQARDAKRRADVNAILNAVYQYAIDHQGILPSGIPSGTTPKQICVTKAASCNGGVDLDVLTGSYIVAMPTDPHAPVNGTGTDYFIMHDSDGRLTISAPLTEQSSEISTTR